MGCAFAPGEAALHEVSLTPPSPPTAQALRYAQPRSAGLVRCTRSGSTTTTRSSACRRDRPHALEPNALHICAGRLHADRAAHTDGSFTATRSWRAVARPASPRSPPTWPSRVLSAPVPGRAALMPDLLGESRATRRPAWHRARIPGRWRGACCCWRCRPCIFPFTARHERRIRRLRGTRCARGARRRLAGGVRAVRAGAPPNAAAIAHMRWKTTPRCAMPCGCALRAPQGARHGTGARFPDRFIPRYSMVMFHPEISYAEALRRGAVQAQLLDELDPGPGSEPDPAARNSWSGNACRDNLKRAPAGVVRRSCAAERQLSDVARLRCVAALERHERD